MKIPANIKQKINQSINHSKKAVKLQEEIIAWFESQNIDTQGTDFIDCWGYLSNNECSSANEFEEILNGENPFER